MPGRPGYPERAGGQALGHWQEREHKLEALLCDKAEFFKRFGLSNLHGITVIK